MLAATRKTLAIALCALPTLARGGVSAEPLCETDGIDETCAAPPGASVLQRTQEVRAQSLKVTEADETESQGALVPPTCGGTTWKWMSGDGTGGTNFRLGWMGEDDCKKYCIEKNKEDSNINGCTFSPQKNDCWAEKGMRGHKRLVGWITAFLPKQCIPVTVSVVNMYVILIWHKKELADATLDAYSSYPCLDRKYVYHAKQLHNGDVITGPIHLFMSKSGVVSVACPNDRHTFCDSVKDGPMILDGWGSRCPEKNKDNWDHYEIPR